jgi:hypothetical protein
MHWYGVCVVLRSTIDGVSSVSDLFEESFRVIRAASASEAAEAGELVGRASRHEYRNEHAQLVRWDFVKVSDVQELDNDELSSGDEVFSRLSVGDPDAGGPQVGG